MTADVGDGIEGKSSGTGDGSGHGNDGGCGDVDVGVRVDGAVSAQEEEASTRGMELHGLSEGEALAHVRALEGLYASRRRMFRSGQDARSLWERRGPGVWDVLSKQRDSSRAGRPLKWEADEIARACRGLAGVCDVPEVVIKTAAAMRGADEAAVCMGASDGREGESGEGGDEGL